LDLLLNVCIAVKQELEVLVFEEKIVSFYKEDLEVSYEPVYFVFLLLRLIVLTAA